MVLVHIVASRVSTEAASRMITIHRLTARSILGAYMYVISSSEPLKAPTATQILLAKQEPAAAHKCVVRYMYYFRL